MQNPHQKLMGIHWRTILLLSHLYSKWQLFTHRIIYTPHHRQVAKLHIMLLNTPSHNKRQTFTSIHSIAKSAENATDFSMPSHLFMALIHLLLYVYFIIFKKSRNIIKFRPYHKSYYNLSFLLYTIKSFLIILPTYPPCNRKISFWL